MPPGPTPKPDSKRERTNAPTFPSTELRAGQVEAPDLPNRSELLPMTCLWWDTWAGSPQAEHFLATDWLRFLVLVDTVEAYFAGDLTKLTEIRLNEKEFGATPESRLRLRMKQASSDKADEGAEKTAKKRTRRRADPRLKMIEGGK